MNNVSIGYRKTSTQGVNLRVFPISVSFCVPNLVYQLSYSKSLYHTHPSSWYLNTFLSDMTNICHMFHTHPFPRELMLQGQVFFLGFSCCASVSHKGRGGVRGKNFIVDAPDSSLSPGACRYLSHPSLYPPPIPQADLILLLFPPTTCCLPAPKSFTQTQSSAARPQSQSRIPTAVLSFFFFFLNSFKDPSFSDFREAFVPQSIAFGTKQLFLSSHQRSPAAFTKENSASSQFLGNPKRPKYLTRRLSLFF